MPSLKPSYRAFWDQTGEDIPPFFEAPSTEYYFFCEKSLFLRYFPDFKGKKILKTDLWDEAKNSRILVWAAEQGMDVFGIDISHQIAGEARLVFEHRGLQPGIAVSDMRAMALASDAFDGLYSMGTVEHFHEHRLALRECHRVLKKGGRAIIGVPNARDPFFRPLMVAVLSALGLYAYGYEKSFSMGGLEKMLREAGFRILGRSGILFMPGWLRMLDLFLHVRKAGSDSWMRTFISPFARLYRRFPWLRRHGYLIACIVEKP